MSITGLRLKNLRRNIHASQSDVAHAIGISRTAYVKYETGASKPVRKLHELAKYFNVSTDYLLGNENADQPLSEEQTTLLEGFDSLNAEGQNTLMTMLKSLRITHSARQQSPPVQNTFTNSGTFTNNGNFNNGTFNGSNVNQSAQ